MAPETEKSASLGASAKTLAMAPRTRSQMRAGLETWAGDEKSAGRVAKRPASDVKTVFKKPAGKQMKFADEDMDAEITVPQRDRNKNTFFEANKTLLPQEYQDMITTCKKPGDLTHLINNIVHCGEDGSKRWNLTKPCLQQKAVRFKEAFGKDPKQAVPERLAAHMWGGNVELQEALQEGQCSRTKGDDNLWYYSWRELKVGTNQGRRNEAAIVGQKDLTEKQGELGDKVLASLQWDVTVTTKRT